MTKIIVCGGRNLADHKVFQWLISNFPQNFPLAHEIIQGGATGADRAAYLYARHAGITYTTFPANWKEYGKAAGMIRNQKMLDYGCDAVLAFPGGVGTAGMIKIARKANVPVHEITGDFS
ncbi:hypothetical protein HMSP1_63 [Sinorhizobium phage HMSP1-Susan]|nr:hypothetical protein HMSP1_63 [Sinorhizobium phage HMSP1-Susan]